MTEIDQLVDEGGLALVGEFSTIQEANEYALVVLAMNLDCWLRMGADGRHYALYADPAFAVAIREEFGLYDEEQNLVERRALEPPIYKSGIELAFLWAVVLFFVFAQQNSDPGLDDRFCNSSLALFDGGEWWRPFTSLFLHGDVGHLLGNILVGGIFCVFVAHTLGPLLGWALILASGVLGNVATANLYYPEPFTSLGASTATFGALGILVGSASFLAWRSRSVRRFGAAVIPIVVGAIMLGWWGGGGGDPQVDVAAHVFGFAAGAVLGFLTVLIRHRRPATPAVA